MPIDRESRIFEPEDGAKITLGGRELELIHTPGHALHHYCVVDPAHELIFSGDTFGISYRDFDVDGREFIFPTTTPVHFDPEALCSSVDRLMSYAPRSIFLTHYGEVRDLERLAREMKERVRRVRGPRPSLPRCAGPREQAPPRDVCDDVVAGSTRTAFRATMAKRHWLLDDDVELNCAGIEVWLDRK